MSELPRHRALALLAECTGDDIWSVEHCEVRRVPQRWVTELSDAYESGFRSDDQTTYTDAGVTNQYHGIRDVDLAIRIAAEIGIRVDDSAIARYGRARLVQAIKDAVMDGDDSLS